MTEPLNAAERLRMVASDPGACVYKYLVDESLSYGQNMATCMRQGEMDRAAVIAAYLQETDPTPIDEAFARMVAVKGCNHESCVKYHIDESGDCELWFYLGNRNWRLFTSGMPRVYVVTIGDFFTAARLYRVQLKEGV